MPKVIKLKYPGHSRAKIKEANTKFPHTSHASTLIEQSSSSLACELARPRDPPRSTATVPVPSRASQTIERPFAFRWAVPDLGFGGQVTRRRGLGGRGQRHSHSPFGHWIHRGRCFCSCQMMEGVHSGIYVIATRGQASPVCKTGILMKQKSPPVLYG